jgi:murein DD-endopeptidase MepM/ murein hydrolase activator NlpD
MRRFLPIIASAIVIGTFIVLPVFTSAETAEEMRAIIAAKQAQIQELEKQIATYNTEIKSQKSRESTLNKQIANMQLQIKKLEADIQLTLTKISATSLKINQLSSDISVKNAEIEKQKVNLSETIREINLYDQTSPLQIVLASDTFSSFLSQVESIENLQGGLQAKLDSIQELKGQLENSKADAEDQKAQLEQLHEDLSGQNTVLSNQKSQKNQLLTDTKNQEKKYQQMLTDLQKQEQQIQKDITALEDRLRLMIDPSSIPGFHSGVLSWPIKGAINQGYGPTSVTGFINDSYNFHNGIDIDANIGDPVKSAGDGVVKAIGNDGKYAYGKWIAIDHQNGLVTLYGHFSGYAVSVGQKVKAGQVIGYAGNTGFSTGPHVHFTVYAASTFSVQDKWYGLLPLGGSINPMNYL